jgi:membrane protein
VLSGRLNGSSMFGQIWQYLRAIAEAFVADDALSRGASISFYTVTSIGPVLFIVVAIAGLVFGEDAARGAVSEQLSALMGKEEADLVQRAVQSASDKSPGIIASVIGVITLLITASGVFGEMQSALNMIWKAEPHGTTISRLIRARAASLGLVAALGFLLLVSLVVSALLSALAGYIDARLPFSVLVLHVLNFAMSFVLISVMLAAIYKVLPDAKLSWRDVLIGAVVTALLFNLGKFLIGLYLAHSALASSYGAAGALIVILMWVYYSAQIFLLGAEFTKIYASRRGTPAAVRALA